MSEWRVLTIADLGQVVTGSTPSSRNPGWFGELTPFVTPSDMIEGDRRPQPARWLSAEGRVGLKKRLVPPNSIAFVSIGATIGKVCLLSEESLTNQQINTVVPGPNVDGRFVYYLLRHSAPVIAQAAGGAATPIINKSAFSNIVVNVPGFDTQSKIGEVLGAFDDLIENNRRRVELLEEMARSIYREWFVHFRYPGHEDVPLVESELGLIPAGWKVSRLGEVARFEGGSAVTKASYTEAGYPAFSASGADGFLPTFEIEGDGVVLSAVGARCGRTFWASGRWSSIANTIKIIPDRSRNMGIWLYLATENPSIWPKRGSAQPFVSINDARAVKAAVATSEIFHSFESISRPLFDSAHHLRKENGLLANLRDLLLPKLVTGQIDVSTLDLDALISEALAEGAG